MFPTKLDDYPTLSSIISFCANAKIQYMDMTAPHKQISYRDSEDTSLWRYGGLDPKIINNIYNTEENGTTTCIMGNPHDVDNMAANFSLTAWGV